jgi:hypothetical protein
MSEPGADGAEQVASLTEEVRLLVELVAERAAPWLADVVAAGHGPDGEQDPGAAHRGEGPDCGWCPLCAVVAVVRGQRPEAVARLLEQVAALVALLRAVLADRWQPEEGVHMPGFAPRPRPSAPRGASPRVQHISVHRRGAPDASGGRGER